MGTYVLLKNTHRSELPPEYQNDDVRFSESLVEHFLREFTYKGDVILDPFAGYGTTLLVAEEMGRIPYGIEFDAQRVEYIRSKLKHPDHLIHGDARQLVSYNLPPFDFSITSPPYMGKHDRENPFTNYTSKGSYDAYLQDIRSIYKQVRQIMKPNARVVIEVANLKLWDGLTTLAWDVAEAVSRVFRFEGEIVVGWDTYGFGYDHSYCLVFTEPKGEMDLHLAVVLSCTDPDCRIQFLDSDVCVDTRRSKPMIEHNIIVRPDQLVVVDANANPPQVVYCLEWIQTARSKERARYTSALLDELPFGAKVLDLGCGAGVPTTWELAQRFNVTGVDISARQISLAQQNVPEAHFVQADITQLDFPPASFDAVAAFYSIIHVPRQEQPKLLQDIASWLRPGGLLVATMGTHSIKADYAEDFLGVLMYCCCFDSES
jgi:SAM-dependent methyltransferase